MKPTLQKRKRYCSRLPSLLISLVAIVLSLSITVSAISVNDGTLQVTSFYGISAYDMWNSAQIRFYDGNSTWYEPSLYGTADGADFYSAVTMVNTDSLGGIPMTLGLFYNLGNVLEVQGNFSIDTSIYLPKFQVGFEQDITIRAGDQIEFYISTLDLTLDDRNGTVSEELLYLEWCYGYDNSGADVLSFEVIIQSQYEDRSFVCFRSERLYDDITVSGLNFYPEMANNWEIGTSSGVAITFDFWLSPVIMGPLDSFVPKNWTRTTAKAFWTGEMIQVKANNGIYYNFDGYITYPGGDYAGTGFFAHGMSSNTGFSAVNTSRLYFDLGAYQQYIGSKTTQANGVDFSTFEVKYPASFVIPKGQQVEFYVRIEYLYWQKDGNQTHLKYFDNVVGDISGSSETLSFDVITDVADNGWIGFRSKAVTKDTTISSLRFTSSQITSGTVMSPMSVYYCFGFSPALIGELDTYPLVTEEQLEQIQVDLLMDIKNELDWLGLKIEGLTDAILDESTGEDPPDYGAITGDPSYDVGGQIGEDEAIAQLGQLQNGADVVLASPDMKTAAQFWQSVFRLLLSVEAVGVMSTVIGVTLVIRTLVGR